MIETLLLVGILVAVFVGYNIGGATTGVSFGPAVGAHVLSKLGAAALMSVFFFLGGWIVGPAVVETLGEDIVPGDILTLEAGIGVLFFIGLALFAGNLFGVPASTSMTAVGSIAGLGLATGTLDWATMGEIVSWWIVAPIVAFWVSGVIGRYFYPQLNEWVAISRRETHLWVVDRSSTIPKVSAAKGTDKREITGSLIVVGIGCYMAFSSGASNVANAVAPLVGSGALEFEDGVLATFSNMEWGIILAGVAVTIGAFTIARRTLETMGNDITNLPLTAAVVVMTVSATIVTLLSAIGIPVQLVIVATMSIIGLGWGRATRTTTVTDAVRGSEQTSVSVGALTTEEEGEPAPEIGEEEAEDIPKASDLFDPSTTARVILVQNFVPVLATLGAFLTFRFVPIFGF
ncbi:inorganic phosphate transporter [Natronorubrum daqingense]|uniref:Phosphate transporter n=1 Tax=Natronorubrum daqingense TaxID=588898 RepID=A0A1N7EQL1_9EURY|nr:inorganic phosphate transporter [Natronorubrum daqingense]APX97786.1 inorganic phosphate transporter [Natronorubrum daqingense]SIR90377.1 inorganic phosphate transporter, PiT family [Natronorubrum daqingense]